MLLFALHLAQQLVAALGFRHKDRGPLDGGHNAGAGFFIRNLQQVVGKRDAGHIVQGTRINRNAGEVVLAQQLEELFESERLGNRKDLRPRRHHLAHQLVAELDGRAHQVDVVLFENALFFPGFQQRLDIDGRLLLLTGRRLRQRRHGEEEAHKDGNRSHQPQQQADGPDQLAHPASARAVEEQRRQKLVAEHHHQHNGENGLRDLRIGGPRQVRSAIEQHHAELQRNNAQRQLLQHRRGDGCVLAAQAELRLDQLFPCVQIFLDFARENLAELGVDAADVGGQRLHRGE